MYRYDKFDELLSWNSVGVYTMLCQVIYMNYLLWRSHWRGVWPQNLYSSSDPHSLNFKT